MNVIPPLHPIKIVELDDTQYTKNDPAVIAVKIVNKKKNLTEGIFG